MSKRYTLEEFKVSVFHKLVGTELHLLRQTLLEGVDGVLELVEGTKERSPGGTHAVDADNVKNGEQAGLDVTKHVLHVATSF